MRGLTKAAALLFGTALAINSEQKDEDPVVALVDLGASDFNWPSGLAPLFEVEIDTSEAACDYGNVYLNGQVLDQTDAGDRLVANGILSPDSQDGMKGSWSLKCIIFNDREEAQLLKVSLDSVNGEGLEGSVGFSMLFTKTGTPEVLSIEFTPVESDDDSDFPLLAAEKLKFDQIESAEYELRWMYAQMRELEHMIYEKRSLLHTLMRYNGQSIKDCDSLKCVAGVVVHRTRMVAYRVFEGIHGYRFMHPDHEFEHHHRGHPDRPRFPKFPGHGGHHNHSCGDEDGKWNHTLPHLPPWKRPHDHDGDHHHHFLPICRYPPPHKEVPWPPRHGDQPPSPPGGEHPHSPLFDHPDHTQPDSPPGQDDDNNQSEDLYGVTESNAVDTSSQDDLGAHFEQFEGPSSPQWPENGPPHFRPEFDGPVGPGGHLRNHIFGILKVFVVGFLVALLLLTMHRRMWKKGGRHRADRAARREERRRRRAFRRGSRRNCFSRLFRRCHRSFGSETDSEDEWERAAMLGSHDGGTASMTSEISQLRNAADVVGDIVAAEEGRSSSPPSEPTASGHLETDGLLDDYDGFGMPEELPAYEMADEEEDASNSVSDGFMYTPGSTDYAPDNVSDDGGSDILGPDRKRTIE